MPHWSCQEDPLNAGLGEAIHAREKELNRRKQVAKE